MLNYFSSTASYAASNLLSYLANTQTQNNQADPHFEEDWVEIASDSQPSANPLEQSMIVPAQNSLVEVAQHITTCCSCLVSNNPQAQAAALAQLNENTELLQPLTSGEAYQQLQFMQQQQSSKLLPVAVMIIKANSTIQASKGISPKSLTTIDNFAKQVKMLTNLNEKSPLYSLTQLSLEVAKMNQIDADFDGYVLKVNERNELELVKETGIDHGQVSSELVKLIRTIKTDKVLTKFSDKVIVNLLYSSLYLFTNYSKLLSKNTSAEGLQPIVNQLQELITNLRSEIEERKSTHTINPALLAKISTALESIGYANMDDAKSNFDRLGLLENVITLVESTLMQSSSTIGNQIIRHPTEFEKDVKIFQTADKNSMIVIFDGDDSLASLHNPVVATERVNHGMSGTMLNLVKTCAEKKKDMLDKIMVRKSEEFAIAKTIIFAGFGIDGAAAEFAAGLLAKNTTGSQQQFMAVGVGAMDYLSNDAVAEFQGLTNLNSFKFTWQGDTLLNFNTAASRALGNRTLKAVGVNIPIHCADVYLSDTLKGGHVKDIYANDIKKALGRAKLTYGQVHMLAQDIRNRPIAMRPVEPATNSQIRIVNFNKRAPMPLPTPKENK